MVPWMQLAAMAVSQMQQKKAAREKAIEDMKERRIRQLGGNTDLLNAHQFNRDLDNQDTFSAQQMMGIFGSGGGGGGGKNSMPNLGDNQSAYSLREPRDVQLEQPRFTQDEPREHYEQGLHFSDNDEEDPYYLRKLKLI